METPNATTVLVVDDDPSVLRTCARELAAHGLSVLTADSPIGVSALVRLHQPSVVVLDLDMPAISGERVAELLRNGPAEAPAIIFFSGLDNDSLEALWQAGRCTNYVGKREGTDALAATVMRYVGLAQSRRSGSFRLAL